LETNSPAQLMTHPVTPMPQREAGEVVIVQPERRVIRTLTPVAQAILCFVKREAVQGAVQKFGDMAMAALAQRLSRPTTQGTLGGKGSAYRHRRRHGTRE
jgi:hypothetical protein